tara:strand:+ start:685 stop:1680 length:996 start_codon:yes stop_codon:yes gene_type:complete
VRVKTFLVSISLFSSVSFAGEVEDQVSQARQLIFDAEFDRAAAMLDQADVGAPNSELPVTRTALANIPYYRGVLDHYLGEGIVTGIASDTTMDFFREAIVFNPRFDWDRSLVSDPSGTIQDLFVQLKSEIDSRVQYASRIPEDSGVRVFLDGIVLGSDDFVVQGRHLVQVMCEDQSIVGEWVEFGDSPDFGCMCGESSCFGNGGVAMSPEDRPASVLSSTSSSDGSGGSSALSTSTITLGAGGAVLLSGIIYNFVVAAPVQEEVQHSYDNPNSITPAQFDDLSARWDSARFTTLGLLGAGAVVTGVGGYLYYTEGQSVSLTPNSIFVTGSF